MRLTNADEENDDEETGKNWDQGHEEVTHPLLS